MKHLCLFFLFIISLNKVCEAQCFISGKIADDDGETLSYADVTILSDSLPVANTLTDAEGKYQLEVPCEAANLVLKVERVGYDNFSQTILFSNSNKKIQLDVGLRLSDDIHHTFDVHTIMPPKYAKVPGTATKLSAQDLSEISPIGTQEALKYVPGVHAFADDGFGNSRLSIGIRGLNPRRSARVLLLEDGIPIQPAPYIYPNAYYNPPVERIQEIEVIKGSAALRHGPHTMGGVVNYITSRPRDSIGGIGSITLGTNGYFSSYAEVGGWGTKKIRPEIQLLYKGGDGYRDNNTFNQLNFTAKAQIIASERKNVYIKYNFNKENLQATYTGLTEYTYLTDPRFNPKKDDEFDIFRTSLSVIYESNINKNLKAITRGYGSIFLRDWWRENDVFIRATSLPAYLSGTAIDDGVGTISSQNPTSNTNLVRVGNGKNNFGVLREFYVFGVEQSYEWDHLLFKKKAHMDIGARYHFERFKNDLKIGDSPDDREGAWYTVSTDSTGAETKEVIPGAISKNYETTAGAFFIQENIELNKRLLIRVGTRIELFEQSEVDLLDGAKLNDKTNFVILPGFGFNYTLFTNYNIFGGVHRGYTAPPNSLFNIPTISNSTQEEGLDLKPETSINAELGLRGNNDFVAFEVAGFYLNINDMVAAARSTVLTNLGKAQMYGIETGGKLKLSNVSKFLPDVNVSYTFLQTEITEGALKSHLHGYNNAYIRDANGTLQEIGEDTTIIADISGNELPYAPHHTLSIGLSKKIRFGSSSLTIRGDMQYTGDVFTDVENLSKDFVENATYLDNSGNPVNYLGRRGDAGPIPGYYIFNASATFKYKTHWVFQVAAKNLLDEVYISSRLHSSPGSPGATASSGILVGFRRQINLNIAYKF